MSKSAAISDLASCVVTSISQLICVIKDWQTMLAALLALVAAWWTVSNLKDQVSLQKRIEEDRLRRTDLANRAALPLAINTICEKLDETIGSFQLETGAQIFNKGNVTLDINFLDKEIIELLKNNIQASRSAQATAALIKLLNLISEIQEQILELKSKDKTTKFDQIIARSHEWFLTFGKAHALAKEILPYARNQSIDGPAAVSWAKVNEFFRRNNFDATDLDAKLADHTNRCEYFWTAQ